MIIFPLFILISLIIEAKSFNVEIAHKGIAIEKAKVILEQDDLFLEKYSNKDGRVSFDVEDKNMFIKIFKDGYRNTGNITKPKDISFSLKSINSSLKGKIYSQQEILSNQKVIVTNLFTNEVYEAISDKYGEFLIKNVPIMQNLKISLKTPGYLPYNENISLDNKEINIWNIFLNKTEKSIVVKLLGEKVEDIEIKIEDQKGNSDKNGSVSFQFRKLEKEKIHIFINNKRYIKKIDPNRDINVIKIDLENY